MNTERNEYNVAKRDILSIVNILGQVTSKEIALITGRSPECASMNLLRYHGMGLLHRRTLKGRMKAYTLTERGRERLAWLSNELSEESG